MSMKEFALLIANYVYKLKLGDDVIIASVKNHYPTMSTKWINEQIETVRKNPKLYERMQ